MIDFDMLDKLIASARDRHKGKPLDTVRSLHGGLRRGSLMRNCRLYKVNDTNWEVTLHDNTIARIVRRDDGTANVTVHSVRAWPTVTTAERLTSVLGVGVWKHDNKLRVYVRNYIGGRRAIPPMVDGQEFHIGPAGVVCMNPEIITEWRTRILKEPSKPVLAYLRKVKKLATVYIKLGSPMYSDLTPYVHEPLKLDIETAPDMEVVMRITAVGAYKRMGLWRVKDYAEHGLPISEDVATGNFEMGLRYAKDMLYSQHGVYERYTHSFADQFEDVRRGRHAPLALAA